MTALGDAIRAYLETGVNLSEARWRVDEMVRREYAHIHKDDDDFYEDDEPVEKISQQFERGEKFVTRRPRRYDPNSRHVPVRFERDVIERIEPLADADGMTVSTWIRAMIERETDRRLRPVGFGCQHMTMTAGGALHLAAVNGQCGCEMQPYYATAGT